MVSSVGRDELGQRALNALNEFGVNTQHVGRVTQSTGKVLVQLDDAGHASYEFAADTAWDHLAWSRELEQLAARTDAVCFGTLGQRSEISRETIQRFVQATPGSCLRVLDVNVRPPFWNRDVVLQSLRLANVLKLNDSELAILAEMLRLRGEPPELLQQIRDIFSLNLVALTRGAAGAVLLDGSGECSDLPGQPTTTVDTVGAGDAFSAALVLGLLRNLPLGAINTWAGRVAAFVCSQPGATVHLPASLNNTEEMF